MKRLNEIETGKTEDLFLLVKQATEKITLSKKKYMDLSLVDSTGEINGKLWNMDDYDKEVSVNSIVKVRAVVEEWQGKKQLNIQRIRPINDADNVNISDLIPSAPMSSESMYNIFLAYIEKIKNVDIKNIVREVLKNYDKEKLFIQPAAMKIHHAVRGGLLYHTTTMLKAGEKISEVYTFLNKDLLYGGIILHDLAKIDEMETSSLGIVNDYTNKGKLLGHIPIGVIRIHDAGKAVQADEKIIMLLEHIELSHHGEPDMGSPIRPMFPEAAVIHFLDSLDAELYQMRDQLKDKEEDTTTDKIYTLDSRCLYKLPENI